MPWKNFACSSLGRMSSTGIVQPAAANSGTNGTSIETMSTLGSLAPATVTNLSCRSCRRRALLLVVDLDALVRLVERLDLLRRVAGRVARGEPDHRRGSAAALHRGRRRRGARRAVGWPRAPSSCRRHRCTQPAHRRGRDRQAHQKTAPAQPHAPPPQIVAHRRDSFPELQVSLKQRRPDYKPARAPRSTGPSHPRRPAWVSTFLRGGSVAAGRRCR